MMAQKVPEINIQRGKLQGEVASGNKSILYLHKFFYLIKVITKIKLQHINEIINSKLIYIKCWYQTFSAWSKVWVSQFISAYIQVVEKWLYAIQIGKLGEFFFLDRPALTNAKQIFYLLNWKSYCYNICRSLARFWDKIF